MEEKLTLKKKVIANLNENELTTVNGGTGWWCELSYRVSSYVYSAVDNSWFACETNGCPPPISSQCPPPSSQCGYSDGCNTGGGNTGENGYA